MVKYSQEIFFRFGWALPAFLPLAQVTGRAAFTVVGIVYLVWACIALPGRRPSIDRNLLWSYGLLALSYALAIPTVDTPMPLLKDYAVFILYSLIPFFVIASLSDFDAAPRRFVALLGVSGAILLVYLYVRLALDIARPGFSPEHHMHEDNLPLLAPLLLLWIIGTGTRWRRGLAAVAIAATIAYVVMSHGRAALVGLTTGLAAFAYFVGRQPLRRIIAVGLVALTLALFARGSDFLEQLRLSKSAVETIDRLSSTRTVMWRNALANPPDNLLIGVGIGNARSSGKVFSVSVGDTTKPSSRHLHNFLLDCWYETGFIGLAALTTWLMLLFRTGYRRWSEACDRDRATIGTLLSAASAIAANALLSYSYTSKQFVIYLSLFLLLATLKRVDDKRS